MGYKNIDYNGENQTGCLIKGFFSVYCLELNLELDSGKGFSFIQGNNKNDVRYSTNKAFLRPIRSRKNLHITTKSYVTKVMFDSSGTQAVGVEFQKNGKMYQVRASKEVILSAGTVATPQILMVSFFV